MKKNQHRKVKHHIVPESRGGKNDKHNISQVPYTAHTIYHMLFDNLTPDEAIEMLIDKFWNGQDWWIEIYQNKKGVQNAAMAKTKKTRYKNSGLQCLRRSVGMHSG